MPQNLLLSARLAGRSVNVDRVLDIVGLLSEARKKAQALSTGMRQRLGLAQAILLEPELLILDEPTSGLDPEGTHDILSLLRRMAEETHVTVVFSSHMLHEVEGLCNRVAIIHKGRLVAFELMDTLLSYDFTHVDLLVDGPEAAVPRLTQQDWVASAAVVGNRLEVVLREENVPRLVAFLVGAGHPVNGVFPQRRTLQDYFLRVLKT